MSKGYGRGPYIDLPAPFPCPTCDGTRTVSYTEVDGSIKHEECPDCSASITGTKS